MSDREKLRVGSELLSKGKFSEGLAVFESLLEADPDDVTAANGLVFALMALEREGEAFKFAEEFSKRAKRPEAKVILATLLRRVGKIEEAEAGFRAILEMSPDNPSALYGMGLTAIYTDLDMAESYANRLEVLSPNSYQVACIRLGILAKRTPAELPMAAAEFVRRFDGHLDAKAEVAALLVKQKMYEEALNFLEDEVGHNFRELDPRVLRRLMQAALKAERWPVGARAGRELCRREVPHVVDFFGYGWASYKLKNWDTAIAAFSKCLEKDPTHQAAALFLYRSYVWSNDRENVDAAARRLVELKPDELGPQRRLFLRDLRELRLSEAMWRWKIVWHLARKGAATQSAGIVEALQETE